MTSTEGAMSSTAHDDLSSSHQPLRRASTTPLASASSSTVTSPKPSREPSPIRPPLKPGTVSASRITRSRKNSQDLSPSRPSNATGVSIPTIPSAAAIQRALSATGTPQIQSPATPDFVGEASKQQRPGRGPGGNGPTLATHSPRFKSPPPSTSSNRGAIYSSQPPLTPSITLDRGTPPSLSSVDSSVEGDENTVRPGMRTPVKGLSGGGAALETVQESGSPVTPAVPPGRTQQASKIGEDDRPARIDEDPMEETFAQEVQKPTESGSESGGNKTTVTAKKDTQDVRKSAVAPNSARPATLQPKKSWSQFGGGRGKFGGEDSARNMTVETETVSSIPQVAVGVGAGERGASGRPDMNSSVRLKPSNETIRPKKEKKKYTRKPPSINAGTASTKADIFEAKVASAVDEANSSDSEETFVYESNPPEPQTARSHRFHSRTPSATSVVSQIDQYNGRHRSEGHPSLTGKKSMKFTNRPYNVNSQHGEIIGNTSSSGNGRTTSGYASHRHHFGRYGRGGGGHTSLFDNESPFPNAAKQLRIPANNVARLSSRPSSPRSPHTLGLPGSPSKTNGLSAYDLEGEGADDEWTPLVGPVRPGRNRNSRRPTTGNLRHVEYLEKRPRSLWRRITGCVLLGLLTAFLVTVIVVTLIMCSKPLKEVHLKSIQNVLASEQEIILDLNIHAVNPNIVAVQVSDLGIDILARSKYVGTSSSWEADQMLVESTGDDNFMTTESREGQEPVRSKRKRYTYDTSGGVDEGTDPIEDPENDSQTMLLGRICEFDSPLIFEPTPIRHQSQSSVGEVRLAKPGNSTEVGGSARWERVLQHSFELIVRGPIRYSLPISSKLQSTSISGSVNVHPQADLDDHRRHDTDGRLELRPGRRVESRKIVFIA